mgnify:CR=1 FL=1
MLWASSQVRRLYAIGVAISCRSPQKVSVFTSLSFTTEGERLHQSSSTCYGRLHQFVVHMLWASSPVRRPHAMGVFTSSSSTCYGRRHQFVVHMLWASSPVRRPHAMGVVTSSSSTCYGRRHQFVNIFLTRGRVLSEFYLPCERTRPSGSKSA